MKCGRHLIGIDFTYFRRHESVILGRLMAGFLRADQSGRVSAAVAIDNSTMLARFIVDGTAMAEATVV